jgi:hypothetical protein
MEDKELVSKNFFLAHFVSLYRNSGSKKKNQSKRSFAGGESIAQFRIGTQKIGMALITAAISIVLMMALVFLLYFMTHR